MIHYEYICDACGFKSEEKQGVYICPHCGNRMRATKTGMYSGDFYSVIGKWFVIVFCFFIFLFMGVLLFRFLGILIAFILTFFVWRLFPNVSGDKAIRVDNVKNPSVIYYCKTCGGRFKGQLSKCPHCGVRLKY